MQDIYTGSILDKEHFSKYGPLSIDHFIPWSFVLHDEPWNLIPTFRDINSSKGDRLPDLDSYLEPFCELQFDAFLSARQLGGHRDILEAYLAIDPNIFEYEETETTRDSFITAVRKTIVPLHQIALNQGFSPWKPADFD